MGLSMPARNATDANVESLVTLDADTRLLVIAPHPDDETLATGGLLQQAAEQGATVSVFMLTHGDNNPWPQRWVEKRLRIGAQERRRWGRKRYAEARQALLRLGLGEDVLSSPGWPDLELTDLLLAQGAAMREVLREHLVGFQPTLVLIPALADAHPDHSAAHLLTLDALRASGMAARCLEYLIHGTPAHVGVQRLVLSDKQFERKRQAVLAYDSQMALSRKRFLHLVDAEERYQAVDELGETATYRLPWRVPRWLRRGCEVLVHVDGRTWVEPIPDSGCLAELASSASADSGPVCLKLRLRWRSAWIFDHWGWRRLDRTRLSR